MPIPPFPQPQRPTRTGTEYTRGKGQFQPELSPIQVLPSHGLSVPNAPTLIGADVQTLTIAVSAFQNSGTAAMGPTVFGFPAIPPIKLQETDQLVAYTTVESSTTISQLTIASETTVVTATPIGGSQVSGPTFSGGQKYANFGGIYSGQVVAIASTLAGNVYVTIRLQLMLYSPKTIFGGNVQGIGGNLPVGGGGGGSGSSGGSDHGGNPPPGGGRGGRIPL